MYTDGKLQPAKWWKTFQDLCTVLAPGTVAAPPDASQWEWKEFLSISIWQFVAPALHGRLPFAPGSVQETYRQIHALNKSRNENILRCLGDVLDKLQTIDVEPVLLKGAASLVDGLYADCAERILSDIDLLVPPDRTEDAFRLLRKSDYDCPPALLRWVHSRGHHLPVLIHSGLGVKVELHRSLAVPEFEQILPAAVLIARSCTAGWNGRTVRLPSPTDRLIHNIVHEQLHHEGAKKGTADLRRLRELALIVSRYGEVIDWSDAARRFLEAGYRDVLERQAAICRVLMGVEMGVEAADPDETLTGLRACMLEARMAVLPPPAGKGEKVLNLGRMHK